MTLVRQFLSVTYEGPLPAALEGRIRQQLPLPTQPLDQQINRWVADQGIDLLSVAAPTIWREHVDEGRSVVVTYMTTFALYRVAAA